jgi:uncharacterized protein YjbI with pentapeptide repeats
LANPEHLARLKEGVGVWNQWRKEHPVAGLDFSGANLHGADLRDARLDWANLREASLKDAKLYKASL